ncbi:MAG: CpXC domain-containing protein [Myxococcota bacterium]
MSEVEEAACPACAKPVRIEVYYSINGQRRADLRAAILGDTLGRQACPHCAVAFRLEPRLSYVDPSRGEWLLIEPIASQDAWKDLEGAADDLFDRTFGPIAPGPAREIGRRLSRRVTFGWAGLREKLICGHLGIDDVALEVVKTTILRAGGPIPLADGVELRLTAAEATTLTLLWMVGTTGAALEELVVPRALLADVAAPAFQPLRDALSLGAFVDLHRLLAA